MKQRYKIKTKNTTLPDEQVMKHKDFNAVMARYQSVVKPVYKLPLYKNPKLFLSLFLAGTIAVLVWIAVKEETGSPAAPVAEQEAPKPMPKVDWEFLPPVAAELTYDADEAKTLKGAGLTLEMHPQEFAFKPFDTPYKGEVTVRMRPLQSSEFAALGTGNAESTVERPLNVLWGIVVDAEAAGKPIGGTNSAFFTLSGKISLPGKELPEGMQLWQRDSVKQWFPVHNAELSLRAIPRTVSDGFTVTENGRRTDRDSVQLTTEYELFVHPPGPGVYAIGALVSEGPPLDFTVENEKGEALSAVKVLALPQAGTPAELKVQAMSPLKVTSRGVRFTSAPHALVWMDAQLKLHAAQVLRVEKGELIVKECAFSGSFANSVEFMRELNACIQPVQR